MRHGDRPCKTLDLVLDRKRDLDLADGRRDRRHRHRALGQNTCQLRQLAVGEVDDVGAPRAPDLDVVCAEGLQSRDLNDRIRVDLVTESRKQPGRRSHALHVTAVGNNRQLFARCCHQCFAGEMTGPTIAMVAARAGVATSTVSRALSNPDRVSKDTRRRSRRSPASSVTSRPGRRARGRWPCSSPTSATPSISI